MKKTTLAIAALAAFGAFAETVTWDFPRTGSCHEGIAFGDGKTGVLVWGGGSEIRLTVGRADLWDHRGGYSWTAEQSYTNIVAAVHSGDKDRLYGLFKKDTPKGQPRNPYMLPLGRVVIKVPGKTLKRGTLDPFTGLGSLKFAEGGAVGLAMSKNDGGVFAMKFPKDVAFEVKTIPATDFPVYERQLKPIGFEKALVVNDEPVPDSGWFFWKLPADKAVWACWRMEGNQMSLTTGRGDSVCDVKPSFDDCAAKSVAYWRRFWAEGARVKVPDPVIQRIYDYGMYRFGAMTDPSTSTCRSATRPRTAAGTSRTFCRSSGWFSRGGRFSRTTRGNSSASTMAMSFPTPSTTGVSASAGSGQARSTTARRRGSPR